MIRRIPPPPFGSGETGGARRAIMADISLAGRALLTPRWPLSPARREEIVEWLMIVLACSEDARAKVAAGRVLVEIDKLNMEQERRDLQLPDRLDVTTAGQPVTDVKLTVTADDIAAARRLLGFGEAGGDVHSDG